MTDEPTHVFEFSITKIPRQINSGLRIDKKIKAHTFNLQQHMLYSGVLKMFVDACKDIKRAQIDESNNSNVIRVRGTKEFCETQKKNIEGIDTGVMNKYLSSGQSKSLLLRAGLKIGAALQKVQNKTFNTIIDALLLDGIIVSLSVKEIERPLSSTVEH